MPWIEWIEDEDADGESAEIYRAYKQTRPDRSQMPSILKCFSQRPDFLQHVIQFSNELHFSDGHLVADDLIAHTYLCIERICGRHISSAYLSKFR